MARRREAERKEFDCLSGADAEWGAAININFFAGFGVEQVRDPFMTIDG